MKNNPNFRADRFNEGKPQLSLIPLDFLEDCAKVLEFGAQKYARDNFRKGLVLTEVLDSLLRHISALRKGEFIDPESGCSHIGHIQANAIFLGGPNNTNNIQHSGDVKEASKPYPATPFAVDENDWGVL